MRAARSAKDFTENADPESPTAPFQIGLRPYVRNNEIFLHPATRRPYLPNYKISRMNESVIANPEKVFLVFEDAPDAEGMRNVAFVDRHVKAFSEAEFQKLRKAQGISESGLPSSAGASKTKSPNAKPTRRGTGSGRGVGRATAQPTPTPRPKPRTRPTPKPTPRPRGSTDTSGSY